ncbi:MAG: hypothetical protein ACRD6W_13030, partial [Nitrososphaerales archaeon]
QGEYEAAKSKTLVWTVVGFIFAGIILGIILLVAYIKFDPLINRQEENYARARTPYSIPTPPPPPGTPGFSPPPPPVCGAATNYIAQYGRTTARGTTGTSEFRVGPWTKGPATTPDSAILRSSSRPDECFGSSGNLRSATGSACSR